MSQLYIHENLIRIQPLFQIVQNRKCDANTHASGILTKINMSLIPMSGGT